MGESHRIRTELGINKNINVELKQDFNFLEILSLKIQQEDVYNRACANYGVVVGRITANNGFGIPNARVSIFLPIEEIDKFNPEISGIYPYTTPEDKNEDGYRYNLLSYEKSYPDHAATGTFPSINDILNDRVAIELYDKYYKHTVKTNESGDFMIMGAPLGTHIVFLDLDLSDIGEFSLSPQDLIRMGRATESQVSGSKFKTSNDLNSLPQIVSLSKSIDVSPLWGDPDTCQISITRVDFDLRDDANIDIQPTAAFMGSLISTGEKFRIRQNCKPKDDMGNLCQLKTGPGRILAIRQTINYDFSGNPILEEYQLEQSGNVIDANGTWMVELPMNLEYVITNEFGEKITSFDPTIGIPTKAKYRFKVMWQQSPSLSQQARRAYYLIPNVREYGYVGNTLFYSDKKNKSYYFGLDWGGYANINDAISCEDTFYEFELNRVYTVSNLIDGFGAGSGRGNFIGIKEIDGIDCTSTVNKFPTNDGVRNFDLIYFIFQFLFQIILLIGVPFLVIYHILAFLWNNFAVPLVAYLIFQCGKQAVQHFAAAGAALAQFTPNVALMGVHILIALLWLAFALFMTIKFREIVSKKFGRLKMAMMTYPDCMSCPCETEGLSDAPTNPNDTGSNYGRSILTPWSNNGFYAEKLLQYVGGPWFGDPDGANWLGNGDDNQIAAVAAAEAIAGHPYRRGSFDGYKANISKSWQTGGVLCRDKPCTMYVTNRTLPIGERINMFNRRENFFWGGNKIKVSFNYGQNTGRYHYDNTITVTMLEKFDSGTLMTFINPTGSTDVNFKYSYTSTTQQELFGITGNTFNDNARNIIVTFATSENSNGTQTYFIPSADTPTTSYKFASDFEHYQVLTAFTYSQAMSNGAINGNSSFIQTIMAQTYVKIPITSINSRYCEFPAPRYGCSWTYLDGNQSINVPATNLIFESFNQQYITILQRGVDPYSPKYPNKYGVGKILKGSSHNEDDITFTAMTRLNIPIQGRGLPSTLSQSNVLFDSYFFTPGLNYSAFTTTNFHYYSNLDTNPSGGDFNDFLGVLGYGNGQNLAGASKMTYIDNISFLADCFWNDWYQYQYSFYYYSSVYFRNGSTPVNINNRKVVMRTDRLPSSDELDGTSWTEMVPLLAQNRNFAIYQIITDGQSITAVDFGTDGSGTQATDLEGQVAQDVLDTFSCEKMVSLNCYGGQGTSFGVKNPCEGSATIEGGCYIFMNRPLLDLGKDIKNWAEWGYRFRFFYALCRGVLSEVFTNNWINGTLYAFPIQVNTYFDKYNNPVSSEYCKNLVHFDVNTNNFYYRSSPYSEGSSKFVGQMINGYRNQKNLLFPTTIMNLGMKTSFYSQINLDPKTKIYTIDEINSTSFSDTSDLLNLFVITRITDEGFLARLFSSFNRSAGINQLFSRNRQRIDGDLAQVLSINSEEGLIKFSPEFYTASGLPGESVQIYGGSSRPVMCIFFSSTTGNLQFKDFLTPGVLDFRPTNITTAANNAITYPVPIKSQKVPLYQWERKNNPIIFGSEKNDWYTTQIMTENYQGLDRRDISSPSYFYNPNMVQNDINARAYIFNADSSGYQLSDGGTPNQFYVGVPFHFYFGLINGATALDKFKQKYSIVD